MSYQSPTDAQPMQRFDELLYRSVVKNGLLATFRDSKYEKINSIISTQIGLK